MVEVFSDRVEITNPGTPLIDPQRFIEMPPRSRNGALASSPNAEPSVVEPSEDQVGSRGRRRRTGSG
ncbi:ATP-binding protein [Agrobacterium cavarae]|uniref:ATP-binding protein n=1 Tax=Agrobacterium cavarae TaxID=2528239 RepID=UPI003FD512F4